MAFLPHTYNEEKEILKVIGVDTTEELFRDIPGSVRLDRPLAIPPGLPEKAVWDKMTALASQNTSTGQYTSFLGAGAYEHYQPSAVKHVISRSEFYTAYTPYQPEVSQGTLQAVFEYQTCICELTGMDVANASVYDGATAAAEAALITAEATRRNKVLVSALLHPEYIQTMETYLHGRGIAIEIIGYNNGLTNLQELSEKLNAEVAGVIIQNPNFLGSIEDTRKISDLVHDRGAVLAVCVDPVSLGVLESPGYLGADIAVGEGQSLGLPLSFGGPYLGFMAVKEKYLRRLPGRIVGKTKDRRGNEGYVLTLQAREQHIRREKASSNICSNQALCALAVTVYLSLLGPQGLSSVGDHCLQKSSYAKKLLSNIPGVSLAFDVPTFKEFVVKTAEKPSVINKRLWEQKILGGLDLGSIYPELESHILLCVTEMRTREDIEKLAQVWKG